MFDWITDVIANLGYIGIALLMLLENLFPPVPSEVIMPLAGFVAARGDLNIVGVVVAGVAGTVAGTLPWYWLGHRFGEKGLHWMARRHGRWLTLSEDDADRAVQSFRRHGVLAVFLGRLVPAIRTVISAPAGVAKMPLAKFLFWTTLGSALWATALALAGYFLQSQYEKVADYMDPVSKGVLVLIVLAYVYRVVTFRRKAH
ncbi:DedA family protein [Coralloluteibacterium stylophorae]|uniref:DedA family protein n=1 Tax=Coralloluteibacterium stylophorae TaxID=1776034 RepID=A0A8J7VRB8_9GAMM|nr:DedA family protein [Coralloluteibacterium stylophorae]MBS7457062.1 DedA family protein [Coralloluteibacterium stylophorae]